MNQVSRAFSQSHCCRALWYGMVTSEQWRQILPQKVPHMLPERVKTPEARHVVGRGSTGASGSASVARGGHWRTGEQAGRHWLHSAQCRGECRCGARAGARRCQARVSLGLASAGPAGSCRPLHALDALQRSSCPTRPTLPVCLQYFSAPVRLAINRSLLHATPASIFCKQSIHTVADILSSSY